MSVPKSQFNEITENIFTYICQSYLESVKELTENGKEDAARLLINVTEVTTTVQQLMINMVCPKPTTDIAETYNNMRERAEKLLIGIESLMPDVMKLCTDCQYYSGISDRAHCTSMMNNTIDPVYGTEKQISLYCDELRQRGEENRCGPYARWFLKKEVTPEMLN